MVGMLHDVPYATERLDRSHVLLRRVDKRLRPTASKVSPLTAQDTRADRKWMEGHNVYTLAR